MKTKVRNIQDIYPLSPMQQGMLFHSLVTPESGVYFEQSSWTLRGDLDVQAFVRAWQRVAGRHTALRTAFLWEGLAEPLQVVYQEVELPLEQQDWRRLPQAEQEARLRAFLQADRERGFELAEAPLMRLALLRVAEDTHQFVWSHHHLLLDGWSLPILFREVFASYQAYERGQDMPLGASRPYRDYIAYLQEQGGARAEAFWRQTLQGFTAPTPLRVDLLIPGATLAEGEEEYTTQRMMLSAETAGALRALARQHQLTLNTIIQGAWGLLLSRYSGEEDVVFGTTVSGRPADLPGAEDMIGLFINTQPVRVHVQSEAPALGWLTQLQAQLAQLRQYEYTPLVDVHGWSQVPRGLPLFESILVFENYPVKAAVEEPIGGLQIVGDHTFTRTNYPLTIAVSPGQEIGLEMGYDRRRFDPDTIQRVAGHLQTILAGLAADPEQRLAAVPLLTEAERQQLLVAWNDTAVELPPGVCVHHLFEAQAAVQPKAIAVTCEGQALTYAELNRRANQLAHYLRQLGVGPETLVGICVRRSPEMVVGLLGVLKAGGAYVPMDPGYPPERLSFMLADAQVHVLLTGDHTLQPAAGIREALRPPTQVVRLDADWERIAQQSEENPDSQTTDENLAYVIYTSGSTGQPKGVMVPHRALANHAQAMARTFGLQPGDRFLQFISLSFDASAEEFFPTLLSGATLVLPGPDLPLTGTGFLQFCEQQQVNFLHLPVSFWHQWVDELAAGGLPVHLPLKMLLVGGESPAVDRLRTWCGLVGRPVRFLNAYGPTETTVTATFYETRCEEQAIAELSRVPIGRPIANVQIALLDEEQQPVPVGVVGEVYIGGAGLARGYWRRPELTGERFVADPHPSPVPARDWEKEGGRLYRTGDLARYLPDGNIEFVGRVDHQVKVRGFRVELEEIEAALRQHPALRQAAVVAHEGEAGDKRLVAYFVPDGAYAGSSQEAGGGGSQSDRTAPDGSELREFLKGRLPDFMVPSVFVMLESMPLTPSGKVDRRALPAPDWAQWELKDGYVAPRTPVEEILAGLWAETLGVKRVGVHDNFFELGGHSLLATRLISRLRETFQIELPLRSLFEAPSVAGLAEIVQTAGQEQTRLQAPPIVPVSREGDLPLSFAQQRLWFLDQLAPGNLFYNIPLAVRLRGRLDVQALERSLNEIVRRHEVLRTTFQAVDGTPVQVIAPDWTPATIPLRNPLPVEDLRDLPEAEREAEAVRMARALAREPFDLARGPLVRAHLFRLDDEEHIALLTMHHIVSDGWSLGVLMRELAALYEAFSKDLTGLPLQETRFLPNLPIQYADFACWQREWLRGEVLETQLEYWKQRLSASPPMLEMPTDRPRPAVQTSRGGHLPFRLPRDLSEAIKTLSQQQGVTLFMTLLAAFQTLLYHYTGQEDISVGTPIANRTRAEIEGLIGFFVNTLVLRIDLSGDPTFEELLKRVREVALGAYSHQDLPFETLVEALQPQRDLSHTPLFQVMLVLNNAPMESLELPGLSLSTVEVHGDTAAFDLTFSMVDAPALSEAEGPDGLGGYVEYNADLFDETTVERMVAHFQTLLRGIVANPDQRISTLPILTEAEQHQMLVEWNRTAVEFPQDTCIHHLFEARVEERPDAVAVTFEGEEWTYRELNRQANQVAHYLRKLEVGRGTLVGVSTERSPEMVVGILGTLKAGGAYLPLDPAYPQERLAFMMEDSQVPVLLTQARLVERLPTHRAHTVCLDRDWPAITQESEENPPSDVTANDLAYLIYTSGSTGKPKGTMLCHRGLCNLTDVQRRAFGIREGSRVLQFSPLSFDASVWETFMALRNGGTLCLARQEVLTSGQELVRLLQKERITNVTLPPSVLHVLPAEALPELQTVIAAGEACTPELVTRWAPGREFFNAYGPTETTVCASMYRCDEGDPKAPPIGRPIANTRLYVLNRHLRPVPAGVPGELYIGGVSLARGYLNQPELTADRFVPDPYSFGRLYKTGDLVRYRADGNIEFLGRIDHQVKVRGFRIELGEIEAALGLHPGLRECAVVARKDTLVAYVVPAQETAPSSGELRSFLRWTLPEYMVPSTLVYLDRLPLSPSGKVDRRALPAPEGVRPELEREYVAPRTATEERLARICAELLELDRVGVHDNFFELGGHSLLATQFVSRVRNAFQVEVPLRSLFEYPTVAGLAEMIEQTEERGIELQVPAIAPIAREVHRVKRAALSKGGEGAWREQEGARIHAA